MKLNRWLSLIMMLGLVLAFNPLGAQADPYPPYGHYPKYHHPRGNAYGWHGNKHQAYKCHQKHFRRSGMGPHSHHHAYQAGPPVTYVAPVVAIPYSQPQPFPSQPAVPGLSGNINWNF
jgi:hypothetical protein